MDRLFERSFSSSKEALDYCHEVCLDLNIKTSSYQNNTMYIHCSLECPWMLTLVKTNNNVWMFSKSQCDHNHWPQRVYDQINQLASKSMQPEKIRDTIKQQFPEITWNDRHFYNYINSDLTSRVQRLIMASTRLCAVVASNEEWANCVENDLLKLLNSYDRFSQQQLESMTDLQVDMIHSDIGKRSPQKSSKKRRPAAGVMSVPSCILYVRSQPLRSISERALSVQPPMTPLFNLQPLIMNNRYGSQDDFYSIQQQHSFPSYSGDINLMFDSQQMSHLEQQDIRNYNSLNYYSSNPPVMRSSIQQRIMLQQEYEQQGQLQQLHISRPNTNYINMNTNTNQQW